MTRSDNDPVPVPVSALADLGVEHWRLTTWLSSIGGDAAPAAGPARHALRKIGDLLTRFEVEVVSMDGRPFDPGLPVRVVDTTDDPSLPAGESVVAETVSPLVTVAGRVARPADVVIRAGPAK